jgi:hypothetical protein
LALPGLPRLALSARVLIGPARREALRRHPMISLLLKRIYLRQSACICG